jgi:hypothetical protein
MAQQALLIANARYDDPRLSQLRAPVHDLSALMEVLGDPAIGSYAVRPPLVDRTSTEVYRTLARFLLGAGRDDTMLVYVASHGLRDVDDQLYLATSDTDSAELAVTALPAEVVCGLLRRSPAARAVLILDCCFSGAGTSAMLPEAAPSVDFGPFFHGQGTGRVVMTATSAEEYAWERSSDPFRPFDGNGGSVFCDALLDGLRSGAADLDGDGEVSVGELYEYLVRRVAAGDRRQTPGIWSHVRGRFVVAHAPGGRRDTRTAADRPTIPGDTTVTIPATSSLAPWDAAMLDWWRPVGSDLRDQLRLGQPSQAEAQGWRALHLADWRAAREAFGTAMDGGDTSLSVMWGHAYAHAASREWGIAGYSFDDAAEAAAVAVSAVDPSRPERRQSLMELSAGACLMGAACLAAASDPRAREVLDRGLRQAPACPDLLAYRAILARDDRELGLALLHWPDLLADLRSHRFDVSRATREALIAGEARAEALVRARRRLDHAAAALGRPTAYAAPTAVPEQLPPDVRLGRFRSLLEEQRRILAEETTRLNAILTDLLLTTVDQDVLNVIGSTREAVRAAYAALGMTDAPMIVRVRGVPPSRGSDQIH